MPCLKLEQLERWAAGEPDAAARTVAEQHLTQCADCRNQLETVRRNLGLAQRLEAAALGLADGQGRTTTHAADDPQTAGSASSLAAELGQPPPDTFPGYEIQAEISRGGQGIVFQAIQQSTKRRVAVKVLREGHFADATERARFEREVQVLGQLKHPNIVTIHDSGRVGGYVFYVMDYIAGRQLDQWVAEEFKDSGLPGFQDAQAATQVPSKPQTLDSGARAPHFKPQIPKSQIDATLRMFVKICDAVNAAHLRGIIHRDLKPSNVRVDEGGEPHVLDFGLAKMAGAVETTASPAMTLTGQFLGSLPWSSPEQAEGVPDKIDLRTDVYSLGVMLYQLLTGKFPHDVTGNMRDALNNILTVEPVKPSALRREIGNEVETIVLKCLQKERERRYQSAGELARDIQRYLAGEPIEAKRDSAWYLLRKAAARYRLPAAVAAAFAVLLAAAAVVATILYLRAEEQRKAADEQRRLAQENEAQLRVVVDFQSSMLEGINANRMGGDVLTVLRNRIHDTLDRQGRSQRDVNDAVRAFEDQTESINPTDLARKILDSHLLAPAAKAIERDFKNQPKLEAALRLAVAKMYAKLGSQDQARKQIERAVALRRQTLGDAHPDTLRAVLQLGMLLEDMYLMPEAEPQCREALEGLRRALGDKHPDTLAAMQAMGNALIGVPGRQREAERYCREALEGRRAVLGQDHPDTLASFECMGVALQLLGQIADAQAHFQRAFEGRRRLLGADHVDTLQTLGRIGVLHAWVDEAAEAERCLKEGLNVFRRVLGEQHPWTIGARADLSWIYCTQGRLKEAETLARENLGIVRRAYGKDSGKVDGALSDMAMVEKARGRYKEAEGLFREALKILEKQVAGDQRWVAMARAGLGACLAHQKKFAEAEPLLVEAATSYVNQAAVGSNLSAAPRPKLREILTDVIYLYEAWDAADPGQGHAAKAAPWRQRLEEIKPAKPRGKP